MKKKILYFEELDSTNMYALKNGFDLEDKSIVVADIQTKGKGRLGREWLSPKGGLWMSLILKPRVDAIHFPKLTLLSGVAVAKTLKKYGVCGKLKWPNDVLVQGKKICGILVESKFEGKKNFVVVGIGVNLNNETPEHGISLRQVLGREIPRDEILKILLEEFEKLYKFFEEENYNKIFQLWRKYSCTLGKRVKVKGEKVFEGIALDLNEDGQLILDVSGEKKIVSWGDVTLTKPL